MDDVEVGRGDWQRYEERRRAIVVNAPADLNPDFDRAFLAALETGETLAWTSAMTDTSLVEQAGNGANEIRNWLIMHAALEFRPGETLAYEPIEQWLTGMGVFMTKQLSATEIS